jgi:hypothetical protein
MSDVESGLLNRARPRTPVSKQPLVVRRTDQDPQLEMLQRLSQLEASVASVRDDLRSVSGRGESKKLDVRTLVAICAIALSITGYVIQDARNTSRQDTEIEAAKSRLTAIERIQATNTEARIRTEVELQQLREGQEEIKHMLEQKDSREAVR